MKRKVDPARLAAFRVLRKVSADGAYAHLAISEQVRKTPEQAAMITELVAGTCRAQGTYDVIIEAAANRQLSTMQPAVVDALRLGTHQLLSMRIPVHAAVTETVNVAGAAISERVTGIVNAVLRKVAAKSFSEWVDDLTGVEESLDRLALETCHPRWIVDVYADLLPASELRAALLANNEPPLPTLCVRPGLMTREELLDEAGGEPTGMSPFGVRVAGNPERLRSIWEGRAGVQDEGSQLVTLASARAGVPGKWLDLCAGPGGKTALLAGLVSEVTAVELQTHRAALVRKAVRAYSDPPKVVVADGRTLPWPADSFDNVLVDAPCTGLGALRRRPDARWRKRSEDVVGLVELQRELLANAIRTVRPGGRVTYVTCSPHREETEGVVAGVLAGFPTVERLDVPGLLPEVVGAASATDSRSVQLWPHRHGTDAMFVAILSV